MFAAMYGVLLLVALAAVVALALRARELCLRAPVEAKLLARTLREHRDDDAALAKLAAALRPAWAAELVDTTLSARAEGDDVLAALEDTLVDLQARADRGLLFAHTLGRIAPPIAFVAAILELGFAFRREAGLLSLQKGLAESIAIGHAALGILTGMTIAVVCRFGVGYLEAQGKSVLADARQCARALAGQEASS